MHWLISGICMSWLLTAVNQPSNPGPFLATALPSMAAATLILGALHPELHFSLLASLAVSGALVTGGYWLTRRLRKQRKWHP